eukprot:12402727-Karenia_brevis.AAC.1
MSSMLCQNTIPREKAGKEKAGRRVPRQLIRDYFARQGRGRDYFADHTQDPRGPPRGGDLQCFIGHDDDDDGDDDDDDDPPRCLLLRHGSMPHRCSAVWPQLTL